ncbi:MAG: aminotransferase class I/II-fold pyridoxal phosphate-dependent enzyme [Streptosporangiales bacterium]|nr:aminotransferase class I/II-fold pyridoxal phosphate-dependent enzyme [Streptosporangiales bacterium]
MTRSRPRPHVDPPLVVDRGLGHPLSEQLAGQLRTALRQGRLRAGERLASSRDLAVTLGVSRTVVTEAYQQLFAEGWIRGRHGSGTYVADVAPVPPDRVTADGAEVSHGRGGWVNLLPGYPWTAALQGSAFGPAWRRAWRLAAQADPEPDPNPRGSPALRAALVDYLRRSRGVGCHAGQVLVTHGATHGLRLLVEALLRRGDRVGVEEPGYTRARLALSASGVDVVPCPVDANGLIVDGLPGELRLVYTTPAHQFPLGGRLSVPRRQALLAWARRHGALVVEDDYDSEFRYDVAPLPALHGLDPGVVVYLGTTAKTLTPDLRVGWLVADEDIVARVAQHRNDVVDRNPTVPQEAVRFLIERGDLDRHVRRMRHEYARRRAAVVEAFAGLEPPAALRGDTAGLHVVVELPAELATEVAGAAGERGVRVGTLDRSYAGPPTRSGLVLGYGAASLADLRWGCALLTRLLVADG